MKGEKMENYEYEDHYEKLSLFDKIKLFCTEHKIIAGLMAFGATSAILSSVEQKGFERGQKNAIDIMASSNGNKFIK